MIKKRYTAILFFLLLLGTSSVHSQCSICTKTAQQLGEKPAKALNGAILYLAAFPLAIMGYIGYRWYESQRN
jgi:glycerol kinase